MINLEVPRKFKPFINQSHQLASQMFRVISRKYDRAEHAYPKELDLLAALADGMNAAGGETAGATSVKRGSAATEPGVRNGSNLRTVLSSNCAGAMSACCCQFRARASAMPHWPRSPMKNS